MCSVCRFDNKVPVVACHSCPHWPVVTIVILLSSSSSDTVSTHTWVIYTGLFVELSFCKRGGVHDRLHSICWNTWCGQLCVMICSCSRCQYIFPWWPCWRCEKSMAFGLSSMATWPTDRRHLLARGRFILRMLAFSSISTCLTLSCHLMPMIDPKSRICFACIPCFSTIQQCGQL